jgi:hypothetical protein
MDSQKDISDKIIIDAYFIYPRITVLDFDDPYDSLLFYTLNNFLTNSKKKVCLLVGNTGSGKTLALKYFMEY